MMSSSSTLMAVVVAIAFTTCQSFQFISTAPKRYPISQPLNSKSTCVQTEDTLDETTFSRRLLINRTLTGLISSVAVASVSCSASAKVVGNPELNNSPLNSPERDALLRALSNKSSDDVVLQAIQNLIPLNPMKSKSSASYNNELNGEWKLLWYNKSDFSPLLKLPSPLRPDSYQYFGTVAEKEVGSGRVAQGLTGGIISTLGSNKELWLSSGAVAKETDPSVLEIYPPFRFQLGEKPGSAAVKQTIVESQSDADFRAVNARDKEAQLAPKNEYEQLYLEDFGSGSLRISVVAKGDPVIVGDMFVHQKL